MADVSGRLLGVTVEGGEEPFWLVAAYLPAQACNRARFHKEHLEPFVQAQPASKHLVVVGDLNIIADPELDRSPETGSGRENQRFVDAWQPHGLCDAFRALFPAEKEYTFRVRATGSTSRIDRALVLVSLLGNLEGARHVEVPRKLSDHSFAIKIRLKFVSEHASGPRLWRFNARKKKKEGVRKIVKALAEALNRSGQGSLERVISRLSTGLRMHEKEERKRVAATQLHLTEEVERMRHLVMGGPSGDTTKALLLTREEQLEAYRENERERLEVFEGLTEELQGEIPSPFLSAKVKMRKERTNDFSVDGVLPAEAVVKLGAAWTEKEVKEALEGLPKGKSPGQDGLPAELFVEHWDLLGGAFMRFVRDFEVTGALPESLTTAVTVLLHKKGEKDLLTNYRPITLLTTVYKVLAKVLANRLKQELHHIISKEQHGV
ncbi:unnamed protein product [Closterium sp. NIES-65]|nr:unnamed protein product [Closterium sp. NIES-65]